MKHHLGEFSRKHKARTARVSRPKRVKHRGVFSMVRHRRSSHRRGMMGGGVNSLAKTALVGVGAAHFAGYIPVQVPFKEELAGAAAAWFLGGKNVKSLAVGGGAVFLAKMLSGQGVGGSSGSTNAYGF